MLGCDQTPVASSCTNPGGVGGDRTGAANLPDGGDGQLGTKTGDAAVVERYSEEGATLLKNDDHALPLTTADLAGGILVTGANANHTVADPTNEASTGFIGRNAVNPLQQLEDLSGHPEAFTFVPANDPDGQAIPPSVLSTSIHCADMSSPFKALLRSRRPSSGVRGAGFAGPLREPPRGAARRSGRGGPIQYVLPLRNWACGRLLSDVA